jgi:segregation and condensation protein A
MASMLTSVSAYRQDFNLESLVKNATWRELLAELVESNQLDPWDIDISKVVDSYIAIVKEMRTLDLHIPANIMLAASILLRMKSETVGIFAEPEAQVEDAALVGRVTPEVPELVPKLRMQPGRKISLNELMEALEDAIKVTEKRALTERERLDPIANFVISKDDIDDKIDNALKLVKTEMDREGLTTFARIANRFNSIESMLLDLFVPLLFLANARKVALVQDRFFDEIFIKFVGGENA